MPSHAYSSLPPEGDYIRLLCLLPNEDEAAPLQSKLRNLSLQKLGTRTHLYEALSYAWGNPNITLPICVDGDEFHVTVNLHAALLRLRDCSFERIIWVDAICINQGSEKERSLQVQLMAKIYSKALRVIVWLGEEAVNTEGALEDICLAANEALIERSKKEMNQQILGLLQRPWFQRIWVLQEVAAARHIVIMCGSMEIDGYAFCLGLKSLHPSYTTSPTLQSLPSLTNLIERAGLRSKYTTNSQKFSLEICSLAELIDMFHTREASDVHDKVYALLGMSSDGPSEAGLQPDYEVPWKDLFQQLVKFVLSKDVSVETCDDCQRAVIKSKGCILGRVSSVSDDRRNITIIFEGAGRCLGDKREWTLQVSAKSIQKRDIVCLLQGASKPTIIRLCKDHFVVVVIAATPLNESASWGLELSKLIMHFARDFLLVWDWESPLGEWQYQEEYQALTKTSSQAEFGDYSHKATRTWNVALILGDLGEYEKAEGRLREAMEGYEIEIGQKHPYELNSQYGLTPLSWAAGNGYYALVNLLLAKDGIDPDLKDSQYGQTPLSWAAQQGHEAAAKLLLKTGKVDADSNDGGGRTPLSWAAEQGHEPVVKLLLETGNVDADSNDGGARTPLSWAAEQGHEPMAKLLLETGKVDADSKNKDGRTPLSWAARQGHKAVVKLLLETGKVDADSKNKYSRTPLSWAARQGHEAIVKLLLETGKVDADSNDRDGRTPLSWAARQGHEAIVKLLLETGKVKADSKSGDGRTPLSWAAQQGHEAVVKLLLETGKVEADSNDGGGRTPLSWAARHGHEAMVKLLLGIGKVEADSKNGDGRTPLSWAARQGHEAVAKLLLETGKVEADSRNKDGRTPLWWAAQQGHEAVVKLLLKTGKVKADSKDKYGRTPLWWAARQGHEAVVKLLLETGKVDADLNDGDCRTPLSWAARQGHEAIVKLLLETGKVDADLEDGDDRTPLLWAARHGHKAVVKLLLETGKVDADSKDDDDRTPLLWAARQGHKDVMKLLLETGKVEADSKDGGGQTPLSWAVSQGHKAVVELLLETGKVGGLPYN